MMRLHSADLHISVPVIELDSDESAIGEEQESGMDCIICCDTNSKLEATTMPCCKKELHAFCVSQWLSHSPLCVYCRSPVKSITFQGAVIPSCVPAC